jgi:Dolichyl-phosphate-mannose-protein mannosyltransferase
MSAKVEISAKTSGKLVNQLSAAVIIVALVVGIGLRVVRLGSVPPALAQDEACNGYDAYSILKTGRDHHGNFLPLVMQGFNDYRMPLFDYSVVPLVGAFGLKPAVIRLGAALWGSIDLIAITLLAGLMLGMPGAAAAALFGALSPWHLPFSRFGTEEITGSATVTLAMVCFFLWLRRRRDWWLLLSGALFGLSLYSYAITKAFTPLMIALLIVLYWRELRQAWAKALTAAAIVLLFAVPQGVLLIRHSAEMQARFNGQSLLHYLATSAAHNSILSRLTLLGANWVTYFTPSFLFLIGDRGDHWTMVHPPGFGQLLPEQAPLILLALAAIFGSRRRKAALLLIGWLTLATLPAVLTIPQGTSYPEPRELATPHVMFDYPHYVTPLTPSLLLSHPDSRHDLLAMAPWILFSALGFVVLLDWTAGRRALMAAAATLILVGTIFNGARFVRYYFRDFPTLAAPYWQYGIDQALHAAGQLDDGVDPIVITRRINQPYIYVLFFEQYPPDRYQHEPVLRFNILFGPVIGFSRYVFLDPQWAYYRLKHGVFVFDGTDSVPAAPEKSVLYPDGRVAYKILVK